jgi:hypothetical protein
MKIFNDLEIDDRVLDTLCFNATVFCKFHLDNRGKIKDIDIGAAPDVVREALKKAFKSTGEALDLFPSDVSKYKKKLLIIPVVLYYAGGCGLGDLQLSDDPKTVTQKLSRSYEKLNGTALKSNYAIEALLTNGEIKLAELECVILSPFSKGYHSH